MDDQLKLPVSMFCSAQHLLKALHRSFIREDALHNRRKKKYFNRERTTFSKPKIRRKTTVTQMSMYINRVALGLYKF